MRTEIASFLAFQTGAAVWLALFLWEIRWLLEISPEVHAWCDIAQIGLESIVCGILFAYAQKSVRNSDGTLHVHLTTSFFFLLPYAHHYIPDGPVFEMFGYGCLFIAGMMGEYATLKRYQDLDDARILPAVLCIPSILMGCEYFIHLSRNVTPWLLESYLEHVTVLIRSYYILVITVSGYAFASALYARRLLPFALIAACVFLHSVLWWPSAVTPW